MEREPDDDRPFGRLRASRDAARSARDAKRRSCAATWRYVHTDAIAASVMVGTGETYIAAFALALGLGDIVAGVAASGPLLAGAVLQLVSPYAMRRLGSHRRWVVLYALLQAASFVPLCAAALHGSLSALGLLAIATFYWATGMATRARPGTPGSARSSRAACARASSRGARASARSRCSAALLAGGAILHFGEHRRRAAATGSRRCSRSRASRALWSAWLLAHQSEPDPLVRARDRSRSAWRAPRARRATAG